LTSKYGNRCPAPFEKVKKVSPGTVSIDIGYDRTINFTTSPLCPNDEARSLVLYGVPAGRVIRLYDSPSGDTSDDWVQIKTLQAISWATVGSFESAVNTSTVEVIPVPNNGLDGKVSRFVVDYTDVIANLPPTLTFKEGASGMLSDNRSCAPHKVG
jgi:hypothetical protein